MLLYLKKQTNYYAIFSFFVTFVNQNEKQKMGWKAHLWTKLILLTHSACRAFHAFTDFLRRNKRTTSVYTWRCLSRLYYLTSHIFTSYKLWGKKKSCFYFLLLFYGMTFQQNNPCSLSQISLFFLLKFYHLYKIWHRSCRQIYCVALTKWLWQSDK